jgi:hypothetical protein
MSQNEILLTPEEVAEVLRITSADVMSLLEDGSLSGMPIAGHWRVRAQSLTDFLREGLQRENIRSLERALHDPARWAKAIREFPDVIQTLQEGEYSPNSLGAFLKDSLLHNEVGEDTPAMGRIDLYHGSGAGDFDIVGPALESNEAKRFLFNARRLLLARGQTDAVSLLDSAPFALFPATNHFNDEFHVLQAELPLQDYEDVRLTQTDKRGSARQLAEVIAESSGPYVRFVAICLRIADPEEWEVFVCHASEDKAGVARPLYEHLTQRGIACWIDEAEIAWGESIVGKIQQGLSRARYVIVVLSPQLLQKKWAQKELRSALSLEIEADRNLVLPLIVGDAHAALASMPFLREKRYVTWSGDPGSIERELRALARKHGA